MTQAVQTATESAAVARDVAASGSTREAGTKLWLAGQKLSDSSFAAALARTLVCAYFLNLCIDDLETWRLPPLASVHATTQVVDTAHDPTLLVGDAEAVCVWQDGSWKWSSSATCFRCLAKFKVTVALAQYIHVCLSA